MGLESATFIQDLVEGNPLGTDKRKQGDDHLRLVKTVLKTTLPSADRALYPDAAMVTVADSGTPDVLGAASDYVLVNGSTTITSFGTGINRRKWVRFAADRVITYNGTTLITPTATSIRVLAGETMLIASDGSSNVRVLEWNRKPMPSWSSGIGPAENLIVKKASNSTIDIDATAIYVRANHDDQYRLTSVNLTIDITVTGANGLDTGSEASGTWYYVFVIYNPVTNTTAGLLSASASPTLPSGYTHYSFVGQARNNGSSNFEDFLQRGKHATCERTLILSAGSSGTSAQVVATTGIPPLAAAVDLLGGLRTNTSTATMSLLITDDGQLNELYMIMVGVTAQVEEHFMGVLVLSTAQTIRYLRTTGGNGSADITVLGWHFE